MTWVRNQPTDIWKYVNKTGEGCWLWTKAISKDGYGKWVINRKTVVVHRFVWELVYGPIPDGLFVCHKCDVRACARPDHLFLGTHKDNMRDMREKGRAASGDNNSARKYPDRLIRGDAHHFHHLNKIKERNPSVRCPDKVPRGSGNGNSKLSEAQVIEIRNNFKSPMTYREMGKKYGVGGWMIAVIIKGKYWRHLIPGTKEAQYFNKMPK